MKFHLREYKHSNLESYMQLYEHIIIEIIIIIQSK
jgi:hypothetical protein